MGNINYERFKYQTKKENYLKFLDDLPFDYDFNQVDKYGETILTASISNGNLPLIKTLIEKGIDINGSRKAKYYPLELACLNGNFQIVELLFNSNLLNFNRDDDSSLINASMYNELEIIDFLIKKGININRIVNGRAALHWAVQEHHIDAIELLLKNGADINLIGFKKYSDGFDEDGEYPLGIAGGEVYEKKPITLKIYKLLLERGANPNIKDGQGCTELMGVVLFKKIELVKLLLDFGANLNSIDNEGATALFYAKLRKQDKIAELLIEKGANPNLGSIGDVSIKDLDNEELRKKAFIKWFYPKDEMDEIDIVE